MDAAEQPPQQLQALRGDNTDRRSVSPTPSDHASVLDAANLSDSPTHDRDLRPELSIVIPVHNEMASVERCIQRVCDAARNLVSTFEVVIVDDGSTDDTPRILAGMVKRFPQLHSIRLARNVGQQQATLIGVQKAQGQFVATMDADLPIDPSELGALLDVLRNDEHCDVASGARQQRSAGPMRRAASRMVTVLLNRMCGSRLSDPASTFQLARRRAIDYALQNEILAQNLPLFYAFSGLCVKETPVTPTSQPKRTSRYRPASLVMALALAMLNYSSGARTLSVLLLCGASLMLAGTACCAVLIVQGMIHRSPLPTNLLLAGSVAVVFGGQFIAFSFLGYKLEALMRNLRLRGTPITFSTGRP